MTVDSLDASPMPAAGQTVNFGETWEVFADYDGRFNGDHEQHIFSGGLRLKF